MTAIPTEGIWMNVTGVKHLSLRFCIKIRDFSLLKQMARLERLDLFSTDVTDEDLVRFIPYKLTGIDLGYCQRLKSPQVMKNFLLERSNLQMIGLAALEEVVNDEVSIKQLLHATTTFETTMHLPIGHFVIPESVQGGDR